MAPMVLLAMSALPGCVLISANLNPFSSTPEPLEEYVIDGEGKNKILLLDISRVISSRSEENALSVKREEATTARVLEELNRARKDDSVCAVVLRINSPGGTVTASDTIFHELLRFKEERRVPVVAQLMDTATSGAYYVALASDEIVASPTTVTGSVGVVMYGINLSGLMTKIGIKDQTLKSGALKDSGSPLRPMTPEDAQVLQEVLTQMQARFLGLVRQRRPALTDETVQVIADGRVLTADQALQGHLVDHIGYLEDSIRIARQHAGVSEARVVMYRRSQEFAENIYSQPPVVAPQVNLVHVDLSSFVQPPQLMYLWLPSLD